MKTILLCCDLCGKALNLHEEGVHTTLGADVCEVPDLCKDCAGVFRYKFEAFRAEIELLKVGRKTK